MDVVVVGVVIRWEEGLSLVRKIMSCIDSYKKLKLIFINIEFCVKLG